ncbi:MAG: Rieske (2Fe-2S) protein [Deltaproteobacteria bacterium]|jgi:cytochrome b6-f complex iron-sulfur subunit|nr:Rieske (2Fe-2S) protein [Deltaproteobacteria bacterium]
MSETPHTESLQQTDRRHFLNWIWAFFGAIAAAEFGWVGLSFLKSRKERNQPISTASIITAGPVERFKPKTVTAIPNGGFYLARLEEGSFLPLSRTCTHLGCTVPWVEEKKQFVCPCHGSTFSLTGEVITSPAPRPLDTFPARIENGIVKVDIASPRKRERFDPTQATRPSS